MSPRSGTQGEPRVILVVEDDESVRKSLDMSLRKDGYRVLLARDGDEAIPHVRKGGIHLVLTDLKMPRTSGLELLKTVKAIQPEVEVILMTAFGTVETAVEAMKQGAYDFIEKPFNRQTLLALVRKALEKQSLVVENRLLKEKLAGLKERALFIGKSESARKILSLIEQVAPSSATVLIQGKSGTGKGLVARLIHQLSGRGEAPFIHLSCAAIPETLLEAELFGFEKGAFTGATQRREGRFEIAGGGSLFLDEVSEAPASTQVKLLRVLQDGEFERLGGRKTLRSQARIIAATNRDLAEAVEQGRFREDLYYRLNVITITVPPLAERGGDILLLANHFLNHYAGKNKKVINGITQEVLDIFGEYGWPGNVRELENVIERAVVVNRTGIIGIPDLPDGLVNRKPDSPRLLQLPIGTSLKEAKRRLVLETLRQTRGDKITSAKILGVATRTIYRVLACEKNRPRN